MLDWHSSPLKTPGILTQKSCQMHISILLQVPVKLYSLKHSVSYWIHNTEKVHEIQTFSFWGWRNRCGRKHCKIPLLTTSDNPGVAIFTPWKMINKIQKGYRRIRINIVSNFISICTSLMCVDHVIFNTFSLYCEVYS